MVFWWSISTGSRLQDIYYIDGSKDNKLNIAAVYKIGERNRIKYATNWNLGRRALRSLYGPRISKIIKTRRETSLYLYI